MSGPGHPRSRYTFPPKGAARHRMSPSTLAFLEKVKMTDRLPDGKVSSSMELGQNKNGVAWDDNVNPPSRKLIPPGRPNRAPAGYTKNVGKEPPRRQNANKGAVAKKTRNFTTMNPYELTPEGNQNRASHGLPPVKPLATRDKSSELIINALRFGEKLFPRGMTLDDIVESLKGGYTIPSGPNFIMGITSSLTQLISRGLISKTYGLGIVESRYKLLYYNGPDCGLSICGLPVSEITKWPTGNGLPGSTSLLTRPARVTCASTIKREKYLMSLPPNMRHTENPLEPKDYVRRSYPPGGKLPPLVPREKENPMYAMSFADRAGGLESLKPDYVRRPNTPVSGSSEDRGKRSSGDETDGLYYNHDDGLDDSDFGTSVKPYFRQEYFDLCPPPPTTAVEDPDLIYVPGMDDEVSREGRDLERPPGRHGSRGVNWLEDEDVSDYELAVNWRGPSGSEENQRDFYPREQVEVEAWELKTTPYETAEYTGNNDEFDGTWRRHDGTQVLESSYKWDESFQLTSTGCSGNQEFPKGRESGGQMSQALNEEQTEDEEECGTLPTTTPESTNEPGSYQKYAEEETEDPRPGLFGDVEKLCNFGGTAGTESDSEDTESDETSSSEEEEDDSENGGEAAFELSEDLRNMNFSGC